ncbi:hypothetical protein RRG08_035275 [Elysia crispata]|uniref:MADF domain-containing protein n=1 Tax=Elysia crispata TaxID=231223 RepID=A0AAE1DNS5_9GAST|nr:hypothetical protein RRG08_035275 [Elysia crispata]
MIKSKEDYSKRSLLINQLWIDVGQEVGIDGATAKKKWLVLRDSFRRHHKKETYKSWVHDDSLDTLPDIDIAPQAAADMQAAPSPSLDPQPGPSNSAMHRLTTHNDRKRRYPAFPQSRASKSVSPFDVAMLDALKSLQQQ